MKAYWALFKTEFKLSLRDMNTLIFGIGMPMVMLVILGVVMGTKPAFDGASYSFMDQSFPAMASICICATGLMSIPLTFADYRNKKILKRFLVTPASPALMLAVHFTICACYSVLSVILLWIVGAVFYGIQLTGSLGLFILSFFFVMISIYSIGMMIASVAKSIKTANLLTTLAYFPMLVLSGTTLPYEVMPRGLQVVADFLPLTQGIKLLKATFLGEPLTNAAVPIIVLAAVAVVCIGLSVKFFKWE